MTQPLHPEFRTGGSVRAPTALERAAKAAVSGPVDLAPGSLLNMELSQLAFNQRVLELARDQRLPLLERVRFLSIFGRNMDEFFMTRVAGFQRQIALGNSKKTLDGLRPAEQLRVIEQRTRELVNWVDDVIYPEIYEQLASEDLELLEWEGLSGAEQEQLRESYGPLLHSALTPIRIPPSGAFPHVRNLRPALLVRLGDGGPDAEMELVELPGDLPRFLPLPGGRRFLPIESFLRAQLDQLFGPRSRKDAYLFRVTRSGNLSLDADDGPDIVRAVAEHLARRPFQPIVRIEVEERMHAELREQLLVRLSREAEDRLGVLTENDIYPVSAPLDLSKLQEIAGLPIDELRFPEARRGSPFHQAPSIFDQITAGDVLARFPSHSFARTVERFIQEAARDPAVEEIRITLYRTSRSSRLVRLLRRAHRRGKRVVVLIELKASFDESRNIEWSRTLEAAGIQVHFGAPFLKVHAKIASVVRREGGARKLYTYVGTGNLNASTAAAYTDLGLFTANPGIGQEIENLFATMAGDADVDEYESLVIAPFNMRSKFLEMIEREIEHVRSGRPSGIQVKLNGIADREVISALYRASTAGVRVDLLVRGICALRPGVPGLSDRIRVVALAGRYLEHTRIFRFENGGSPEYFIGSADWRGRNLSRRVEVASPVRDPAHRNRLDRILTGDLRHPDAWDLLPDGRYVRRSVDGDVALAGGSALAAEGM